MASGAPANGATMMRPGSGETGSGGSGEVIDPSRERLIDQLLPAEPSRNRRFAAAVAVVVAGTGFGLLWGLGWIVPQPTLNSTSQQSATMGLSPDGDQVVIGWLAFDNTSRATLELTGVTVDAPGLAVDRITWMDSASGSHDRQPLPTEIRPGGTVLVELWARPESCTDPTTEWGTVRGHWTYPDRPSWWGRWESLDNPLWNPAADPMTSGSDMAQSAISLHPVEIDGQEIELDGPLSAACVLLGVER